MKKNRYILDDVRKVRAQDFLATFTNNTDGHQSSVSVSPVWAAHEARERLEQQRNKGLASKSQGKSVQALLTNVRVGNINVIVIVRLCGSPVRGIYNISVEYTK